MFVIRRPLTESELSRALVLTRNTYSLKGLFRGSFIFLIIIFFFSSAFGQDFLDETSSGFSGQIEGYSQGSAAWGDYNNDGGMDLIISGRTGNSGNRETNIFRNTGNGKLNKQNSLSNNLTDVSNSSLTWGDYNQDGWIDLFLTGESNNGPVSILYRNSSGSNFIPVTNTQFVPLQGGSASWGDYDNDGDLDLVYCGDSAAYSLTRIYRNDGGGNFTNIHASLAGVAGGIVSWGDYNRDGLSDLLVSGSGNVPGGSGQPVTRVYRNLGKGVFQEETYNLPDLKSSGGGWIDYDNDGYLDLVLSGNTDAAGTLPVSKVFHYDPQNDNFSELATSISSVREGSITIGDYNADGFPDFFLTGKTAPSNPVPGVAELYTNTLGTGFIRNIITSALFPGVSQSCAVFGDYSKDKKLDLYYFGVNNSGSRISRLFRNISIASNNTPGIPQNLTSAPAGYSMQLSWDQPSGTSAAIVNGFSYNVYIGTTAKDENIVPAHAAISGGGRRIVRRGNAHTLQRLLLDSLGPGTYYWSVQTIDQDYEGSPFATEGVFTYRPPDFLDITDDIFSGGMLSGLNEADIAWADFDNDRDPDLLVTGRTGNSSAPLIALFENNGGKLTRNAAVSDSLPGIKNGSVDWGDMDNDGYADILLTGEDSNGGTAAIYRNDGGNKFVKQGWNQTGLRNSGARWADFNRDGWADVIISGQLPDNSLVTNVYLNDRKGGFIKYPGTLKGFINPAFGLLDINKDGTTDIVICGENATGKGETWVYLNRTTAGELDLQNFSGPSMLLVQVKNGSIVTQDFNNDGRTDLAISGETSNGLVTRIYENINGVFSDINAGITGIRSGTIAWGDMNDDGFPELAITGQKGNGNANRITQLYLNEKGQSFTHDSVNTSYFEPLGGRSTLSWADVDSDGKLDLFITGRKINSNNTNSFRLYRNINAAVNSVPGPPSGLAAVQKGLEMELSWKPPSFDPGLVRGLNYNIYVGTSPGSADASNPLADYSNDGYRRVIRTGNVGQDTVFRLTGLTDSVYYWSVQAIDQDFEGSKFAAEGTFTVKPPDFDLDARISTGASDLIVSWCDVNRDNYQDVLVGGKTGGNNAYTAIYLNDGTGFGNTFHQFGFRAGHVSWGDYNGDGWPDLLMVRDDAGNSQTALYRNDSTGFSLAYNGFDQVNNGAGEWMDVDNDGDQDIVISGRIAAGAVLNIYINDGGSFTKTTPGLSGITLGLIDAGDYDRDGDMDLLVSGQGNSGAITMVYDNDGKGGFTDAGLNIRGLVHTTGGWGNYNHDGYLDILLSGDSSLTSGVPKTWVLEYNPQQQAYSVVQAPIIPVSGGSALWGDYNEDGYQDILLAGKTGTSQNSTDLYINQKGSGFAQDLLNSGYILDLNEPAAAWADFDLDGKLDLMMGGIGLYDSALIAYHNISTAPDLKPQPPENLKASLQGGGILLEWTPPVGVDTDLVSGYSYNLMIGTIANGTDILSPLTNPVSGSRYISEFAKLGSATSSLIRDLPQGDYYWSVQSVGADFEGSDFFRKGVFRVAPSLFQNVTFDVFANIPDGFSDGVVLPVDLDQDKDMDMIVTGKTSQGVRLMVYSNDQGDLFSEPGIASQFEGIIHGTIDANDFDRDGDVDLLICGENEGGKNIAGIYRNNGSLLFAYDSVASSALPRLSMVSAAWGDAENDGDDDILVAGMTAAGYPVTRIYENTGDGKFRLMSDDAFPADTLVGIAGGMVAWGDFDADGYQDIAISGNAATGPFTGIYHNEGDGTFRALTAPIIPLKESRLAWGDANNDGYLDLLISGEATTSLFQPVSRVYVYNPNLGSFEDSGAALRNVKQGFARWGDYDDDGFQDIILAGKYASADSAYTTRVYRNDGSGNFIEDLSSSAIMPAFLRGDASWVDLDSDGKLDLFFSGLNEVNPDQAILQVFQNLDTTANWVPLAPENLSETVVEADVTLAWEAPLSGINEREGGLTYNILITREPSQDIWRSPNASPADGSREILRRGNAGSGTQITFHNLPDGNYNWWVQTIDTDFEGSVFVQGGSFLIINPEPVITSQDFPRFHEWNAPAADASITIADDSLLGRVLVRYRGISEKEWTEIELPKGGNQYIFGIEDQHQDEVGVEYVFEAIGIFGASVLSDTGRTYIEYTGDGLKVPGLKAGTEVIDYNILAVPLNLSGSGFPANDLGDYNIFRWRFWHYFEGKNREYPDSFSDVEAGKGYWLIMKNLTDIYTGPGTTVEVSESQSLTIDLKKGWNQIGNPYNFKLLWADVRRRIPQADAVLGPLILYKNGVLEGDILQPFEGAMIEAEMDMTIEIPVLKNTDIQRRPRPGHYEALYAPLTASAWELRLLINTESGIGNPLGGFGMNPLASEQKDPFDLVSLPRLEQFAEVSFDHPEHFLGSFTRDVIPTAKQAVWNFEVKSNVSGELLTLSWNPEYLGENNRKLILFDVLKQKKIDMKSMGSYRFWSDKGVYPFRVYFGHEDLIDNMISPDMIYLGEAYPNPTPHSARIPFVIPENGSQPYVEISVRNLQGVLVARPVEGYFVPGFHEAEWQGTDQNGRRLPAGLYIYQITVTQEGKTFTQSRKLMLYQE